MDQGSADLKERECFTNTEMIWAGFKGVEEGGRLPLCGYPIQVFLSNPKTCAVAQILDRTSDLHLLPLDSVPLLAQPTLNLLISSGPFQCTWSQPM